MMWLHEQGVRCFSGNDYKKDENMLNALMHDSHFVCQSEQPQYGSFQWGLLAP